MSPLPEESLAFWIDTASCSGCHACQVACKAEHRAPLHRFRIRVQTVQEGSYPDIRQRFVPGLCQHCADAPCLDACPVGAIFQESSGRVMIHPDRCVGTGACEPACPYGAIYLNPDTGIADKCDWCSDRVSQGAEPACVATCPTDALHFGKASTLQIPMLASSWDPENSQPRIRYTGLTPQDFAQLRPLNPPF